MHHAQQAFHTAQSMDLASAFMQSQPIQTPMHLLETPVMTSSHVETLIKGAKSGKGRSSSSRHQAYPAPSEPVIRDV